MMGARPWVWVLVAIVAVGLVVILAMWTCRTQPPDNGTRLTGNLEECCPDADADALGAAPAAPAPPPVPPASSAALLDQLSRGETPLPVLPPEDQPHVIQVSLRFAREGDKWQVSAREILSLRDGRLSPQDVHEALFAGSRPRGPHPDFLVVVVDSSGQPRWWTGVNSPTTVRNESPGPRGGQIRLSEAAAAPAVIGLRLPFVADGELIVMDTTGGYQRHRLIQSLPLGTRPPDPLKIARSRP